MLYTYRARDYVRPGHEGSCAFIHDLTALTHTHDFYELYLVVSGATGHLVNGRRTELITGSAGLIRPADVHTFERRECHQFNLIMPVDLLNQVVDFLGRGPVLDAMLLGRQPLQRDLPPDAADALGQTFERFMLTPRPTPQSYNTGLKLVATAVMEKLFFQPVASEQYRFCPEWLQELLEEMRQPENLVRGLEALYELSCYTHEHLSRTFKRYLGVTPTQFLNALRLKEASKMLIYTGRPILEVAQAIGFDSVSHFYHLFKANYNTSPLRYRKDHQINLVDI